MRDSSKKCPYCQRTTRVLNGAALLGPNGDPHKNYIVCTYCDAWINCLPGTEHAGGTIADKDLRQLRRQLIKAFESASGIGRRYTREELKKKLRKNLGHTASPYWATADQCKALISEIDRIG